MLDKLKFFFKRQVPEPMPDPILKNEPIMVRAVGFCKTDGCKNFNDAKFVFGSNPEPTYFCRDCQRFGYTVKEEWWTKRPDDLTFFQVRLEYDYRPSLIPNTKVGKWHALCIVSDDSMDPNRNVYYLRSPLIRTEKRAKEIATATLSGLMQDPERVLQHPNMRAKVTEIDFDKPLGDVKAQLWELGNMLSKSKLLKEYAREAK